MYIYTRCLEIEKRNSRGILKRRSKYTIKETSNREIQKCQCLKDNCKMILNIVKNK